MQAVTFEQLGGPEALRLREIDEPQLRANQVLVRVQAVAVDHVDTFVRSGAFQTALATPHVVGRDLVGTVLRVAAGVTKFAVGDLVWTNSAGYDGRMGRPPKWWRLLPTGFIRCHAVWTPANWWRRSIRPRRPRLCCKTSCN